MLQDAAAAALRDFRLRSLGLSRCGKSLANIGFGREIITITIIIIITIVIIIIIIMQKNWCNDRLWFQLSPVVSAYLSRVDKGFHSLHQLMHQLQ